MAALCRHHRRRPIRTAAGRNCSPTRRRQRRSSSAKAAIYVPPAFAPESWSRDRRTCSSSPRVAAGGERHVCRTDASMGSLMASRRRENPAEEPAVDSEGPHGRGTVSVRSLKSPRALIREAAEAMYSRPRACEVCGTATVRLARPGAPSSCCDFVARLSISRGVVRATNRHVPRTGCHCRVSSASIAGWLLPRPRRRTKTIYGPWNAFRSAAAVAPSRYYVQCGLMSRESPSQDSGAKCGRRP